MNRSDFLKMIENTGPSDRHTTGEINEIIDIFPYCHSAYMLLLKGLQNTSDVSFENQLRKSAMNIADREVLYYFLKQENVEEEQDIKNIPGPDLRPSELLEDDSADSQQVVIETAKNSEDLINEIEKSESEGMIQQTEAKEIISDQRPLFIHTDSDNGDSAASFFYFDDESESDEERVVYMDPGFSVPQEEADLLELDTESSITEEDKLQEDDRDSNKQMQNELIDKFILTNPRIEQTIEKSNVPLEDISKPFSEETGEFVTETLAKIYTTQGYYSRAIDIYEKLSLKFPEKSSYFASQIEKVKELIKK